jgi:hypothetical protein
MTYLAVTRMSNFKEMSKWVDDDGKKQEEGRAKAASPHVIQMENFDRWASRGESSWPLSVLINVDSSYK